MKKLIYNPALQTVSYENASTNTGLEMMAVICTYEGLKHLRDNSMLEAGVSYRYLNGTYEIIVTAIDSNSLSPTATTVTHTDDGTDVFGVIDGFLLENETHHITAMIATQAQFEVLISSDDWLGATRVCFIGDGGTLEFEADGFITIPASVKQLRGMNNAIITCAEDGGIGYSTMPTGDGYRIDDLTVNGGDYGVPGEAIYAFSYCTNLTNCTGTSGDSSCGTYAFYSCSNLTNCTGTSGNGSGSSSSTYAFYSCSNLTNCTGTSGNDGGSGTYAFSYCTNLTNCTGTSGDNYGGGTYAFYGCYYASNCQVGGGSAGAWGGTNTKIDYDTCAVTRPTT